MQVLVAVVFFAISGVLFFFTKGYSEAPQASIAPSLQAEHDPETPKVEEPAQSQTAGPENDGIGEAREVDVPPVESKMATVY